MIAALALAQAPLALAATKVRRMPAAEARQGVAADARSVFAIANSRIARYEKSTGKRLALWSGDPKRFPHVNSCARHARALVCAASNYPAVPMRSEVLTFDADTLRLREVRPLGPGRGSLTWLDRRGGEWWACFAHYDGRGGEPGRDHRATVVVRYTARFRETGAWRFPATVLARFAPSSSSGGAWGAGGLLYVTGHDRPELYALRVPRTPGVLEHVATIATPTGGQAIGWDGGEARALWTIDRKTSELVLSRVPGLE